MRFVGMAALVCACSSSNVCTPGVTQACLGPGACQGVQACMSSGTGFGACDCGGNPPDAAPADAPSPDAAPSDAAIASYPDCPTCMHAQYVIGPRTTMLTDRGITIPQSNPTAILLGCDINGDGAIDNQLGKVFGALKAASSSFDVQADYDRAFMTGSLVMLLDFEYTPSLTNTSIAGVKTYVGAHDPTDGLTAPSFYMGGGRFTVTQSGGSGFGGRISGGAGQFGQGDALLQLMLVMDEPPYTASLERAFVMGNFAADGITTGKLCGAIRASEVVNQMITAISCARCGSIITAGSAGRISSAFPIVPIYCRK